MLLAGSNPVSSAAPLAAFSLCVEATGRLFKWDSNLLQVLSCLQSLAWDQLTCSLHSSVLPASAPILLPAIKRNLPNLARPEPAVHMTLVACTYLNLLSKQRRGVWGGKQGNTTNMV